MSEIIISDHNKVYRIKSEGPITVTLPSSEVHSSDAALYKLAEHIECPNCPLYYKSGCPMALGKRIREECEKALVWWAKSGK